MSNSKLLEVYLDKNVQQEKRLFSCNLCSYRTDRSSNLKRHCKTMHETSGTVLECCGNSFVNKAALRLHTAAYHRHGYVCTICQRVFCRRALLRRHHAVHSGYKEFACNQCDYATSHRSNLDRHRKIHDNSVEKVNSASIASSSSQNRSSSRSSSEMSFAKREQKVSTIPCRMLRDHDAIVVDPILAGLLVRPSSSSFQGETFHWVYHSPFNSYHQQQPVGHYFWQQQHETVGLQPCAVDNYLAAFASRDDASTLFSVGSQDVGPCAPRQHTIDGILGERHGSGSTADILFPAHLDKGFAAFPSDPLVVTTVANHHWSVGHLSCPLRNAMSLPAGGRQQWSAAMTHQANLATATQFNETQTSPPDTGSGGSSRRPKCQWTQQVETSEYPSASEQQLMFLDEENIYIPKKLRMSKRHQTNVKAQVKSTTM